MESCNFCITDTSVTINDTVLHTAGTVAEFHSLLGQPSRILPAGSPAPVDHRNNHVHYYDHLGIRLSEHHFTYQISGITAIFNTADASLPTTQPFSGSFQLGGLNIKLGTAERELQYASIPFLSSLPGTWFAKVQSAPEQGHLIHVSVSTQGRKLASGKRSKRREILSVSLSLEHDPWDTTHRPK